MLLDCLTFAGDLSIINFQVFTALAFSLFAQESVDIAIIEVSILLVLGRIVLFFDSALFGLSHELLVCDLAFLSCSE